MKWLLRLLFVTLLVACSSSPSEDAESSLAAIETPTLTILDRGAAEGIRVAPSPFTFKTNARSQKLHVVNRSSFWVTMDGNVSSSTFKPNQGQPDEATFDVGVPGKLHFNAYPGEDVWVDLVPGSASFTCAPGTYVLAAQSASYYVRGPAGNAPCWPNVNYGCNVQSGPRRLLRVVVEACNLPTSVTAHIEGATDQLFVAGNEPLGQSRTYVANGDGFVTELRDRYGVLVDRANLTFDGAGAVAGAQAWVTRGSDMRWGYIRYDAATCAPRTCAAAGAECGSIDDQCGGTLSCGGCAGGLSCGGGGVANKCGAGPVDLAKPVKLQATAFDGAHVYYASSAGIQRVPAAGGASETISGGVDARHLAVDAAYVYFVGPSAIGRVAKTPGAAVEVLGPGQPYASAIAVDASAVYVASNTDLLRVANGAVTKLAQNQSFAPGIVADGGFVWFIHRGEWGGNYKTGSVRRVATNGGAVEEVVRNVAWVSLGLKLDAGRALWAAYGLMSVPLDGSREAEAIFTKSTDVTVDNDFPHALAVRDGAVFLAHKELKFWYSNGRSMSSTKLAITRVPLDGSAPSTLARLPISGGEPVVGMFADAGAVYVAVGQDSSSGSWIKRIPR
jgi:hypothetical protein